MKKTYLLPALLLAFIASLIPMHAAELNLDFALVNATNYDIKEIYIDEASSDKWSDNILKGQGLLKNGETFNVEFSPEESSAKWDIKVVYDDGENAVWKGLKLTDIKKVTLHWSKDKGSSANVE